MFLALPFVIEQLFLVIDDVLRIANPWTVSAFRIISVIVFPSTNCVAIAVGPVPVHVRHEALITSRGGSRSSVDGTTRAPRE